MGRQVGGLGRLGQRRLVKDLRNWRQLLGVGEHSWGFVEGESTLEVVDDIEQLWEKVPAEFYEAAINQPPVEDLDI